MATPFTRALEVVLNLSGLRVNQGLLEDNGYSTKSILLNSAQSRISRSRKLFREEALVSPSVELTL